jgi:hypothetical protein
VVTLKGSRWNWAIVGGAHLQREHPLGPDAGGHLQELMQAAHQQAGADEQHQRQRHLCDHQQVTEANPAKPRAHGPARVLERVVGIRVGQPPGGREAEPDAGEKRCPLRKDSTRI